MSPHGESVESDEFFQTTLPALKLYMDLYNTCDPVSLFLFQFNILLLCESMAVLPEFVIVAFCNIVLYRKELHVLLVWAAHVLR